MIFLILILALVSAGGYWSVLAYQRKWDEWGQYIFFSVFISVATVFIFIAISVSGTSTPNITPAIYRGVSPIAGEVYVTVTQVPYYTTDSEDEDAPKSQATLRVAGEVITVDQSQVYITTSDALPATLYTVDPRSYHPLILPWGSTKSYEREYHLTVPTGGVRFSS